MAAGGKLFAKTRKLTVRTELHLIRERGQGLLTLPKGSKVPVSFSAGTGYGTAFVWERGEHWTSAIEASTGPEKFKDWPKTWAAK